MGFQVHDDPLNAPVDGPTQWVSCCLSQFRFINTICFPLDTLFIYFLLNRKLMNYISNPLIWQPLRHLEELLEELVAISVSCCLNVLFCFVVLNLYIWLTPVSYNVEGNQREATIQHWSHTFSWIRRMVTNAAPFLCS